MKGKQSGSHKIKTYFGKSPNRWQDTHAMESRIIEINNDILTITCDRCRREKEETKRFKIHPDGAISYHFRCKNCLWTYSIYRNGIGDFKQTEKALMTLRRIG